MSFRYAGHKGYQAVAFAALAFLTLSSPVPKRAEADPFQPIDPQNWVNPDNMTWNDFKAPPGTNWSDPTRKGSIRNFNIALVTVDYPDREFVITQPAGSTVFGNPQPAKSGIKREDVPAFYRDLLNKPQELNSFHSLHEYWMEDSAGRYGVNLTVFGAYRLPSKSYQYGVDDERDGFNPGACPAGPPCSVDLRTDAFAAWRADVGNGTASSFELVYILSAGQDESGTWQEFGEMKFRTPEDVPAEFGPPGNGTLPNWAHTRYVNWTSWASASTIWPNAGGGSSTQAESSGAATYAHELSHLLGIGDNYNNPFSSPARRDYTGPFSMLSRGSFNGPGGPHTRWQIPAVQGASMGSLHTMGDKMRIGLVDNSSILHISREALADSGLVVATITARSVDPGSAGLMGLHIQMDGDRSPQCNVSTDPFCDGGGYNNYDLEVIDRMGADSFQPDSGVMISKTKNQDNPQPFQWTIDANPQDINLVDFYRPDGTPAKVTIGDYRQLVDALFHAGTRSGSQFEYSDNANRLHFYIIDVIRDNIGVLHYTVGARSLDGSGPHTFGVELSDGTITNSSYSKPTEKGVTCSFELKNTGSYEESEADHPQDLSTYLKSDIYRLEASVEATGWRVAVPNALAVAEYGKSTTVKVAVGADASAIDRATVKLKVSSEGNKDVNATKECVVIK